MSRTPKYEFLVVGGGLAGLSLALELAHRGARVACVDAEGPGFGCSSASLGLVYPINPLTVPFELAELSMEAWRNLPQAIRRTEEGCGEKARLQSRRLLELSDPQAAETKLAAYSQLNYHPRLLAPREVSAEAPALKAQSSALAYDDVLHLETGHYLSLQLSAFLGLGGAWHCPWEAQELLIERGTCIGARYFDSEIHADRTILATGATSPLYPFESLTPVRGQSLLLQCRTPIAPFLYTDVLDIIERLDGTLHVGSTLEPACAERSNTFEAIKTLARTLHETLVIDCDAEPLQTLSGIRARSRDDAAIVGATTVGGLYAFTGLFRNGVVFAHMFAKLLADHLLKGAAIPAWLSPRRFSHGRL